MMRIAKDDVEQMRAFLDKAQNLLHKAEENMLANPTRLNELFLELARQRVTVTSARIAKRTEELYGFLELNDQVEAFASGAAVLPVVITSRSPDGRILELDFLMLLDTHTARVTHTGADGYIVEEGEECTCGYEWHDDRAYYYVFHIPTRRRRRLVLDYQTWATTEQEV